eukprot:2399391-Heterocapsa_arctica.AAC.1
MSASNRTHSRNKIAHRLARIEEAQEPQGLQGSEPVFVLIEPSQPQPLPQALAAASGVWHRVED